MYLLRFIRRDCTPNEEYYYNYEKDARYHLGLFESDTSNLYKRIELLEISDGSEIIIHSLSL